MADRKITDFPAVTSLASGYIIPLVDLSELNLAAQNKRASITEFDARYLPTSGAAVSGQLVVPSGTAAAPGLGVGAPSVGLFSPKNNTLGFSTAGTQNLALNSSTATFANGITLSGSRAVITNVSGTNAAIGTISGNLGVYNSLNALSVSTFFTVLSGSTASLVSVSGATAVFTSNVQSLTFSGVSYQASSGTVTNPAFAIGRVNTGFYSPNLTTVNLTSAGTDIVSLGPTAATFQPSIVLSASSGVFNTSLRGGAISGSSLQVSNGTVSSPGVAVGQANTGLYLVGPNVLGATIGGQTIIETTSSGVTTFVGSGAVDLPVGNTTQRPPGSQGMIRFNSDLPGFEGYDGYDWTSVGRGATGSGTEQVFVLNQAVVSGSYTIPSGYNASSTGPITLVSGVVITVPAGSSWAVI